MEQRLGIITRNVTTTLQSIDLAKIFGTREVVVMNQDPDNNIFFQPNPNNPNVPTAEEEITITDLDSNANWFKVAIEGDIAKFAVGDLVRITDTDGVAYDTLVEAVDVDTTKITLKVIEGHTLAGTDTLTVLCYKLPNVPFIVRSSDYATSKFLVKHKDNTAIDLYQLSFIDSSIYASNKAPFFFDK